MDSVKGDRLSMIIRSLQPKATYYFKIQARNSKGYGELFSFFILQYLGPLSPVAIYTPRNVNIRLVVNNGANVGKDLADSRRSGFVNEFHAQFGHILR